MFVCHVSRRGVAFLAAAACVMVTDGSSARQLPLEPPKEAGLGITPALEGWYQNADGSYSILLGYFNRNTKETLDIPVGPNNRIEPGGPDLGQPTYFETRRQWGVFTIKVPADFGNSKRYTWTIVANGKTASVPVGLIKDYQIEPYKDQAMGNEPPVIRFEEKGKPFTGPPAGIAATLSATLGTPLTLTAWVTDDQKGEPDAGGASAAIAQRLPPVRLSWHKYRGPGEVKFADSTVKIDAAAGGKAVTTATFGAPGEYMLRAQANDRTGEGGGGFQCCWTSAMVKVAVK